MNYATLHAVFLRSLKITAFLVLTLALTLGITGCGCGVLSKDAWSGGGNCAKQQSVEYDAQQQKIQQDIAAVKKRADAGDVNAQVAVGQFHISGQHPSSDRATGLAYYDKAGRQGNLSAQRIFVTESHNDCRVKAFKLGLSRLNGPQYAPHCAAEWLAMETRATKACVRTAPNATSSIQFALGQAFDEANKSDDADFWYVVAMTHCMTAQERASGRMSSFTVGPRTDGKPQEVRGAMWLGVRGRHLFPTIPLGTPEVEDKAKTRFTMLQAKVARSGVRPVLATTSP